MIRPAPIVVASLAVVASCTGDDPATTAAPTTAATTTAAPTTASPTDGGDEFPDIVAVDASFDDGSETWTFNVTVSSPYDTPDRYADGWRVVGPDGTVYGVHTLAHDHANEQPFTRVQTGVTIPDDVDTVTVEGRDQANGFGGETVTIRLETLR